MNTQITAEAERSELITAALEIEPDFRDNIDGPGRYDGSTDRELTAALDVLAGVSAQDDEAGDASEDPEHLARFGRHILVTSSQGFRSVETFDSAASAANALNRVHRLRCLNGTGYDC